MISKDNEKDSSSNKILNEANTNIIYNLPANISKDEIFEKRFTSIELAKITTTSKFFNSLINQNKNGNYFKYKQACNDKQLAIDLIHDEKSLDKFTNEELFKLYKKHEMYKSGINFPEVIKNRLPNATQSELDQLVRQVKLERTQKAHEATVVKARVYSCLR